MNKRDFLRAAGAGLALPMAARAQQAYPAKQITWVVGFAAGGGSDTVTRMVAAKVAQSLGQSVVVENRPGASGIIAAQYVSRAAPDGYTVLSAEQGMLIFNAAMYSKLPYDPARDFVPVSNMIRAPVLLVAHPDFPAKDFRGLVEAAKAQPGQLHYASPGRGLSHNICMEALKAKAGLDIGEVQYKGVAPAVQDVVAGQVPLGVIDTVIVLPYLKSGKLRALASFTARRLAVTPDVPSMGELGYPDLELAPIVGMVAPRDTPREIVSRLSTEVQRAVHDPEVSGKLTGLGLEIIGDSPEQFAGFVERETARWLPFVRSLNIKLD